MGLDASGDILTELGRLGRRAWRERADFGEGHEAGVGPPPPCAGLRLPEATPSCRLQALTLEAPVPHPLGDAHAIGDSPPMCQRLGHCLDVEQEPVVEGRWDGVHLQGRAEPGWGGVCAGPRAGCCGGGGGAGSVEEDRENVPM